MNNKTKTARTVMWAALVALTCATGAWADTNPANDSGLITVRFQPNVDLGVTVDTTGANWEGASANLDITQDLGTDARLDAPVSIAMAGNFNNQELTLAGAALNTWVLDTDEVDAIDQLRLYAMFGNNTTPTTPAVADFNGTANLVTTATQRAGQTQANEGGDTGHAYELSTGHAEYQDVDGRSASDTFKLWLRSRTPATSSVDGQQAFTVTVTATTGTGL